MARKEKILHSTMLVTLVIILSKVLGFGRDMVTTAYFGRTAANDAYVSAYSLFYLPVLLFNSCISATLIPLFVEEREQNSLEHSNRFASNSINLFALAALVVSALMVVLARPLVQLVYQGFDAEKAALTARLTQIMVLALVFNVTSISVASLLNAMEKYIAAQLTGFPLSVCVIAASVFFSDTYGIEAVAWGVFAANVLQLLVLIPFMRGWFKYSPILDMKDRRFHRLMVLALPAMLSMGVSELNHMIDRMLASTLNAGDISSMTYAFKLIMFMTGVLVVPLTTISFSKMSKQAANKNVSALIPQVRRSIALLAFVILPVVCIAGVCSEQVIRLAYGRGRFDEESVRLTGQVFLFYVIGVPFYSMRDLMNRVYHSMENTKTPMIIACISMALNIVLNLILRGVMGVNGLAFATSVAALIGCILLARGITQRIGRVFNRKFVLELAKIAFSSALALVASLCMSRLLPDWRGTLPVIGWLILVALPGAVVYILSCLALNVKQCGRILSILKRS